MIDIHIQSDTSMPLHQAIDVMRGTVNGCTPSNGSHKVSRRRDTDRHEARHHIARCKRDVCIVLYPSSLALNSGTKIDGAIAGELMKQPKALISASLSTSSVGTERNDHGPQR